MVIWLTGLSGAGKTTISRLLVNALKRNGFSIEWYDGDRVRKELKRESDFSKNGIVNNSFELINKINTIKEDIDYIIVSLITPFDMVRNYARKILGKQYFEVYIKCDNQTLIERDTKGLYKMALNGKLDNLIGFSEKLPYEEPSTPDLILETNLISPENAVEKIFKALDISN